MTTIGWIDALRQYNLGGTSWCVPRKGTIEYDKVMQIRRGEEGVNPKPRRRIIKVHLPKDEPPKTNQKSVKKMSITESETMNRIPDIENQIEKELDAGIVSVSYDLGWKPETTETIKSGGTRTGQARDYMFLMDLKEKPTTMSIDEINKVIDDPKQPEQHRELAKELLHDIVTWKPRNIYFATGTYNTKTKKGVTEETKPALEDYQEFAEEVNKRRGTPIRTITYDTQFEADGRRSLEAYWTITRNYQKDAKDEYGYIKTYPKFVRTYQLTPEFNVKGGATIKDVEEEEERERKKAEEAAKKKEEKEKDPIVLLKKEMDEIREKMRGMPYGEEQTRLHNQLQAIDVKLKAAQKERKKEKEKTEQGQAIKALQDEKKSLEKQQNKVKYLGDEFKELGRRIDEVAEQIKALRKA